MKRVQFALIAVAFILTLTVPMAAQTKTTTGKVKNVIILIPDGMSVAGTTLARMIKGSNLAMDEMICGLVSTWSSDGTIADSAPAGSAFSTGWKAQTGNVATLGKDYSMPGIRKAADSQLQTPVASILEAAKLSGRATGIVSTSEFMHATPADFSGHDSARSNYDNITEQIVYNGLTVVLGGGTKYLTAAARKDKEDLLAIVKTMGYAYATDTASLMAAKGDKLFGVFGKDPTATAMSYDIDRNPALEPGLSEMTAKAIEVLSTDKDGFFLMVEGSKIDWAAHSNDPVGIVTDILAFDRAVQTALDFARKNKDTVVIAVSDHGNSGISIGDKSTTSGYDKTNFSTFITPIVKAKVTGEGLEAKLPKNMAMTKVVNGVEATEKDKSGKDVPVLVAVPALVEEIKKVVAEYYFLTDLTDAEVDAIARTKAGSMNATVGPMLAQRAKIGFTTGGHTGEDVVLYAFDPTGNRPTGYIDNTHLATYMAGALGVDLDKTTARLFVEAKTAFEKKGAAVTEDKTDAENPVLVVVSRDMKNTLKFPRNKNMAFLNDKLVASDGVNVNNNGNWFVSQKLIDLIK